MGSTTITAAAESPASLPARGADGAAPRVSLVEELGQRLSQEIMEGALLPGMRLEEAGLAERFGVSRTPVREALNYLAATGLVQKRPNRGVVVTTISRSRLQQMFEAMAELEACASRLAGLRMGAQERESLRRLHEGSADMVEAGDYRGYDAFNRVFHEHVYEGCHNGEILDLARAMRRRVAPFRRAQFQVPGRLAASFAEHARVVAAILAGDADGAAAAMRAHLRLVGGASARVLHGIEPAEAAPPGAAPLESETAAR